MGFSTTYIHFFEKCVVLSWSHIFSVPCHQSMICPNSKLDFLLKRFGFASKPEIRCAVSERGSHQIPINADLAGPSNPPEFHHLQTKNSTKNMFDDSMGDIVIVEKSESAKVQLYRF